ncbi:RnfABCDGE type electron transport complex subunit G [bacterium]|nr:RnfABCDGE type electron transport complex subunit G [bacterium]
MKDIIRPGLILMAYGLIAGLALGLVNSATAPKIAAQEEAARMAAIEEVMPDAVLFTEDSAGSVDYLVGYQDSAKTNVAGYVITAYGNGFSSTIRTVVGINKDFTVEAIEIVCQSETPGLGTKAIEQDDPLKEPWFERQFDGLSPTQLKVDKDGGQLKSITGATITSRAIARSVANAAKKLETAIKAKSPTPTDTIHSIMPAANDSPITEEGGVE